MGVVCVLKCSKATFVSSAWNPALNNKNNILQEDEESDAADVVKEARADSA